MLSPVASSPLPRGMSTSASAVAARAIMCDSRPVIGSRPPGRRRAANPGPDELVSPRVARARAEHAASNRGAGDAAL